MTKTELQQLSLKELEKLSFTDKFLRNELLLDVALNELDIKHEYNWYYTGSGEIMNVVVVLTEKNKEIISEFIKDFDSYQVLVDKYYGEIYEENTTDLAPLIDYYNNNFTSSDEPIVFDWDKEWFHHQGWRE